MKTLFFAVCLIAFNSPLMAESKKKGHDHKEVDSHNKHSSHGHHGHHHEHDKDHKHLHQEDCGHKAEKHDDHLDYEHKGLHHHQADGHTHECEGPHKEK
jgi:hypothetical protein